MPDLETYSYALIRSARRLAMHSIGMVMTPVGAGAGPGAGRRAGNDGRSGNAQCTQSTKQQQPTDFSVPRLSARSNPKQRRATPSFRIPCKFVSPSGIGATTARRGGGGTDDGRRRRRREERSRAPRFWSVAFFGGGGGALFGRGPSRDAPGAKARRGSVRMRERGWGCS